jgi:hypothetical protein
VSSSSPRGPYFNEPQFNAIMKRFIDMIISGNRVDVAARYAGLHKDSVYEWMGRGAKESLKRMKPTYKPKPTEDQYVRFHEEIENAFVRAEARDLLVIDNAAQGIPIVEEVEETDEHGKKTKVKKIIGYDIPPNPAWAAWKLERRLFRYYGRHETLTVEGGDKPVAYELQWGTTIKAKGSKNKKK